MGDGAAQEADRRYRLLVLEHLDVGEPGGVVDADVHVLPADRRGCGVRRSPLTRWPAPADPAELLDVDVERARPAGGARSGWPARAARAASSLPSPIRARTADTVESGIASASAISAAVKRSRRSAAIAWTRSSGVRCGIERGAEEPSSNPPTLEAAQQ